MVLVETFLCDSLVTLLVNDKYAPVAVQQSGLFQKNISPPPPPPPQDQDGKIKTNMYKDVSVHK